jgi:16S rRNA (adenine1518-N6/adenine1519-N6)-dimethyltransferase
VSTKGKRISGHRPRKRFGQHFLHDEQVLTRIASIATSGKPCNLLEIGPGLGALTEHLLATMDQVTVVELDRDLAARLSQRFCSSRLKVHQMDVLRCDIKTLEWPCPGESIRVVGNLPYNISTPLVFHLLSQLPVIESMIFMMQKEVGNRLTAGPGSKSYGRLSIMTSLQLETEILFDVPPESFSPPPKVDSCVLRLSPKLGADTGINRELLETLVTAAFSQRRKTLRNNLAHLVDQTQFDSAGIDPSLRAEALSVEAYLQLVRVLDTNA